MPPQITAAQMAIIDEKWDHRDCYVRNGRFPKRIIRSVVVRCWDVGPQEAVSAQLVGRFITYANRLATEQNRPRAARKTPEQLQKLQELWEKDPYSTPGEIILVAYDSGLESKEVKNWFVNERKKADENGTLWGNRDVTEPGVAARMWGAYKRDPEGYVAALRARQVSHATGRMLA